MPEPRVEPPTSARPSFLKNFRWYMVLHGESSKRLAPPRNTEDRKHLSSTQSTVNRHNSQTKHQALSKGQPGRRKTPITTAAVHASAQQHGVTRRKLQTPGNAEEHKRQEIPKINPIGPAYIYMYICKSKNRPITNFHGSMHRHMCWAHTAPVGRAYICMCCCTDSVNRRPA